VKTATGAPVHTLRSVSCFELPSLLLEEVVQHRAEFFEVVEWHAEAARRADLVYIYNDDRPRAWERLHLVRVDEGRELLGAAFQHSTVAPKPHYLRRASKGVELNGNSTVARFEQMADGLIAATAKVHIPLTSISIATSYLWALSTNLTKVRSSSIP